MTISGTVLRATQFLLLLGAFTHCTAGEERFRFEPQGREIPEFSADNAVDQIRRQVEFGPRVPGSDAHREARDFLVETLRAHAGQQNVFTQTFSHHGYEDEQFELYNIIASFNPENPDRILLAAHWDTRPEGEEDAEQPDKPIPGADDGGSGVGVLLELARLFEQYQPPVGVDIILFDGEDYGHSGDLEQYFLGSRYWSQNPPVQGYSPRFGILLDMVAGVDAQFPREVYSEQYAPALVDAVWDLASELGFEDRFPDRRGAAISDDHLMVNRHTDIPMINIIHHDRAEDGSAIFPPWWHTQQDNMGIIDRESVGIVGQLVTELVYNRMN